jgi:hypothetical protein
MKEMILLFKSFNFSIIKVSALMISKEVLDKSYRLELQKKMTMHFGGH